MKLSALPIWANADALPGPDDPAGPLQRIFTGGASYQLKASDMRDSDDALVRQSQNGDTAAFEALIEIYQHMIHSLTFRMTGSIEDADDLAQETFIHAYQQIASYRGDSRFSTWLYRIAINLCCTWRRRERRRHEITSNWAAENQGPAQVDDPTVNRDAAAQMQEVLLVLPPKQRAAILLTVYDGLNHAEAAKALNCSETTISWRIFTARRKLRQLLTRKEFTP